MVERFVGRSQEVAVLERLAGAQTAQLVLVYGRRRVGKSFLLQHVARTRKTVFYQATQQVEAIELEAFTRLVRETCGDDGLPDGVAYPSWESALTDLARRARHERVLVVIDEFPYLERSTSGLASVVQRWWDRVGRTSRIMLVLCGSAQTLMEELDGYAAPLHHRFTAKVHVGPLGYREAAAFAPAVDVADKARIFGILGGTPYNLEQWRPDASVRANLVSLFADPTSSLVDFAELVLGSDLPDPTIAYRVLQAIALGKSRFAEIRDYAKVHERALPRLVRLGLIERRTPATEDREKSRRSVYAIADPYFRFYFRFIARNRGLIDRGLGERVVDEQILPHLDDHMGPIFEEMARAFCLDRIRRGDLPGDDVGAWWSTDGGQEIDLVGTANLRPAFVGSVKWRAQKLDARVLHDLERAAERFRTPEMPLVLVGRGGVDARVKRDARVRAYGTADLYAD